LRAFHADVSLALLLGVVERMRVEERPNELPAYIFEAKFEMRMLINGVMATVERGGSDVQALLVCDFLRIDESRRVASARGSNRGIERVRESIT